MEGPPSSSPAAAASPAACFWRCLVTLAACFLGGGGEESFWLRSKNVSVERRKKEKQRSIEKRKLVRRFLFTSRGALKTRCRHQGELPRSSRHSSASRNGARSPRGESQSDVKELRRLFLFFLSLPLTSLEALASLLASASSPPPSLSEEEEEEEWRLLFFFSFLSFFFLSFFEEEPSPRPIFAKRKKEEKVKLEKSNAIRPKNSFSLSPHSAAPLAKLEPSRAAIVPG